MEPAPEFAPKIEDITDEQLIQLLPDREEKSRPAEGEEGAQEGSDLTAEQQGEKRWSPVGAKLTDSERNAIEELWRRYSKTIEDYLANKVYAAGSTLCPKQEPDRKHFVTMSVTETYLSLLGRARRQEMRKGLQAFLFWTALCAAIDLRRKITKKRGPAKSSDGQKEEKEPKKPPIEMVPMEDNDFEMPGRRADELAMLSELRDIIEGYAAESPQNALSVRVARLKRKKEMSWEQLLATIEKYGPVGGPTLDAKVKRLRDFEKHDKAKILPRFEKHGITDPKLLDALFSL